jgi:hypothetical protein
LPGRAVGAAAALLATTAATAQPGPAVGLTAALAARPGAIELPGRALADAALAGLAAGAVGVGAAPLAGSIAASLAGVAVGGALARAAERAGRAANPADARRPVADPAAALAVAGAGKAVLHAGGRSFGLGVSLRPRRDAPTVPASTAVRTAATTASVPTVRARRAAGPIAARPGATDAVAVGRAGWAAARALPADLAVGAIAVAAAVGPRTAPSRTTPGALAALPVARAGFGAAMVVRVRLVGLAAAAAAVVARNANRAARVPAARAITRAGAAFADAATGAAVGVPPAGPAERDAAPARRRSITLGRGAGIGATGVVGRARRAQRPAVAGDAEAGEPEAEAAAARERDRLPARAALRQRPHDAIEPGTVHRSAPPTRHDRRTASPRRASALLRQMNTMLTVAPGGGSRIGSMPYRRLGLLR